MSKKIKKLAIRKTYYYYWAYYILLNLFKSKKKTTYNKRLATKTVADWELQVVVSRAEPVRITFDWRE